MTPYRLQDRISSILANDQKTDVDESHMELARAILAELPDYSAQAARIEKLEAALATAREAALREASQSSCASDFNSSDEVRVWGYAKYKILKLIEKEPAQ